MSKTKILGSTIEEFLIRWNKVTFQIGGLSEKFAEKLSRMYIKELKSSLVPLNIDLEEFLIGTNNIQHKFHASNRKEFITTDPNKSNYILKYTNKSA